MHFFISHCVNSAQFTACLLKFQINKQTRFSVSISFILDQHEKGGCHKRTCCLHIRIPVTGNDSLERSLYYRPIRRVISVCSNLGITTMHCTATVSWFYSSSALLRCTYENQLWFQSNQPNLNVDQLKFRCTKDESQSV